MQIEQFMQSIGLSDTHIAVVKRNPVAEEEVRALPEAPFLDENYTGGEPEKVLALFVRYLAEYSEGAYHARGITHADWLNTMRDVVIWADALLLERGEIGLRETGWLSHLVRTEIFRLGRLQFVPRISDEKVRFGGKFFSVGTPYCEVHIPAGEKLLPAEVEISLARAKALFAPSYFSCESWLLSPRLRELLAGGNILDFAARFTVKELFAGDRSAERYIFGRIGDPQSYEARNDFAKRVKERALKGEYVGSALGYFAV